MKLNSAIYEGVVRHRRTYPVKNVFHYSLFMLYLDLGELDEVFALSPFWSLEKFNLACMKRGDYLGDSQTPLHQSVRDRVQEELGRRPSGPIRMLTHLRYYGHCYNPVSFYYCFDSNNVSLDCVVAEIDNTPWRERHAYVFPFQQEESRSPWRRFQFRKKFHVSPFMGMNIDHDWRFRKPADRIQVHMQNHEEGRKIFDASLHLRRKSISAHSLNGVLLRYPFITVKVLGAIYWQAFRLWRKKAPFYVHPSKQRPDKGGAL